MASLIEITVQLNNREVADSRYTTKEITVKLHLFDVIEQI